MQEQLERDLKAALLSGDKKKVEVLKGIKSAILYEIVSLNAREQGLSEEQIQKVLARESKKRAEAADLYKKAGETERAQNETYEKQIIDSYLPEQLSEEEIAIEVNNQVAMLDSPAPADMGKVIGAVRAKLGAQADGATIARLAKAALENK